LIRNFGSLCPRDGRSVTDRHHIHVLARPCFVCVSIPTGFNRDCDRSRRNPVHTPTADCRSSMPGSLQSHPTTYVHICMYDNDNMRVIHHDNENTSYSHHFSRCPKHEFLPRLPKHSKPNTQQQQHIYIPIPTYLPTYLHNTQLLVPHTAHTPHSQRTHITHHPPP
jgi:hypothetical protein